MTFIKDAVSVIDIHTTAKCDINDNIGTIVADINKNALCDINDVMVIYVVSLTSFCMFIPLISVVHALMTKVEVFADIHCFCF